MERSSLGVSPEVFQTPIDRLELSPRTLNCLKRAHITKVGEVLDMSDDELLKIRNFGDKSLTELREKLAERGITAGDEISGAIGVISSEEIGDLLQAGEAPGPDEGLAHEPSGFTMEEGPGDNESGDDAQDEPDLDDESDEDEE